MDAEARETAAMKEVTHRLLTIYGHDRDPEEVTETISSIHSRFDGHPIRDFVPVLVERYARQDLSA
ncbi:three-helix bundle dimerization domain-containing protein [Actinomadura sp. 6N118]|uniref:three-helix bundle dimerization domain-containing protein n=1 Tax=Actinomadura sp. 6N118 TaxID=3375151 RepID=UPI00379334C0